MGYITRRNALLRNKKLNIVSSRTTEVLYTISSHVIREAILLDYWDYQLLLPEEIKPYNRVRLENTEPLRARSLDQTKVQATNIF